MLKPILIFGEFAAGVAVGVSRACECSPDRRPRRAGGDAGIPRHRAIRRRLVEAPDRRAAATAAARPASMPTQCGEFRHRRCLSRSAAAPAPADSGVVVQPIDAGDVFNKMIARPRKPGYENQIGDAHRALERETRDEGWAYTMEAELQNSMVNEMRMGGFGGAHRMPRHVVRGASLRQRPAGRRDQDAGTKLRRQPFGQRLFLNYVVVDQRQRPHGHTV